MRANSCVFLLLLAVSALASAQTVLRCRAPYDAAKEAAEIRRLAPESVQRTAPHVLRVTTAARALVLKDVPPYDEPLSGQHYYFCSRGAGYLHFRFEDDSLFTGVLVNEQSGVLMPAGQEVIFSPDLRAYFATEQPEGLDGEVWKIRAADGRPSWSGYSFITRQDRPDTIYATLDQPAWTPSGELTARATCIDGNWTRWQVKLLKIAGDWQWRPLRRCR